MSRTAMAGQSASSLVLFSGSLIEEEGGVAYLLLCGIGLMAVQRSESGDWCSKSRKGTCSISHWSGKADQAQVVVLTGLWLFPFGIPAMQFQSGDE
jgi:hypothetical protein